MKSRKIAVLLVLFAIILALVFLAPRWKSPELDRPVEPNASLEPAQTEPEPARSDDKEAQRLFNETIQQTKKMIAGLPTNRELVNQVGEYGLPKGKVA